VQEHEIRVPDQPKVVRPVSLDEELLRMPPKTEHFAVTRPELFLVHRRRLICARHVRLTRALHVRLARARRRTRLILVYARSLTLNLCLSAYVCTRLRFCLWFVLLLFGGFHFLPFSRRSSLRFLRLLLRLLRLRLLA